MANTYKPEPIDLSFIEIPKELVELRELLAKNVHDMWAMQRINDGWTFGTSRDDVKKQHPCLVPYEELDESEKEYDRLTAETTIKGILKNGYKIVK